MEMVEKFKPTDGNRKIDLTRTRVAFRTNWVKDDIDPTAPSYFCRFCGTQNLNHIESRCENHVQTDCKRRPNKIAKILHLELFKLIFWALESTKWGNQTHKSFSRKEEIEWTKIMEGYETKGSEIWTEEMTMNWQLPNFCHYTVRSN